MSELSKDEAKISRLIWQSLNNMHISRSKLCGTIQVPIIHALLKEVCGNVTLHGNTVQWWYKCFREGRVSTEDNPQSCHPSTVIDNTSIGIVATVCNEEWHAMVREIPAETEKLWTITGYCSRKKWLHGPYHMCENIHILTSRKNI